MRHFLLAASQFVEGTTVSIFHSKFMNKSSSYTAQIDIVKGLEHPNNRLYIRMGMKIREIELLVEYLGSHHHTGSVQFYQFLQLGDDSMLYIVLYLQ